jgi:hypothetical protein
MRTLVHVTRCRDHVTRLSATIRRSVGPSRRSRPNDVDSPDILDHKHTDSKEGRTDSINLSINTPQSCSGSRPYFVDHRAGSLDLADYIPRCTLSFTRPHNPSEPISTRSPSHPTRWGCTSYTRNSTTSLRSCPPCRMGWQ